MATRPTTKPIAPDDAVRRALASGDPMALLDERTMNAIDTLAAERSLAEFVRQAWPHVVPTPLVWGWHIEAICAHLEAVSRGEVRDLLITIAPRSTKSLLVSVFWPSWEWTSRPPTQWLTTSYGADLAVEFAVKSRQLMQSEWYRARWGDRVRFVGDQNIKTHYENANGGYRIAVGVGGGATGRGADIITCDDPVKIEESKNESVHRHAVWWWNNVMSQRRNDPATSRRVVIMQRTHQTDLAGALVESGGWTHLNLPTEFVPAMRCRTGVKVNGVPWEDPRREVGEPLWPERVGPAAIEQAKRDMTPADYSAQHQQAPSPPGGLVFERAWWRYYVRPNAPVKPVAANLKDGGVVEVTPIPLPVDEPAKDGKPARRAFAVVILSWDCAFKDLDSSDYVVGQVWGKRDAQKFLLEEVRGHWSFTETVRQLQAQVGRWPRATAKLVEDKANGTAVIDTLKTRVSGLTPWSPEGSKEARAHAVTWTISAGDVFVPAPYDQPWAEAYLLEHDAFPRGAHDDRVDATTQALRYLDTVGAGIPMAAF